MALIPLEEKNIAEGWTYANVYYIRELKDIMNIISLSSFVSLNEVVSAIQQKVKPEGKDWAPRRGYEYVNALIKFKLISKDFKLLVSNSHPSSIGADISKSERNIFIQVFFSYIRFRQFIQLFIREELFSSSSAYSWTELLHACQNGSVGVFSFTEYGKYISKFRKIDNNNTFFIEEYNTHVMRFWDVFNKWGRELNLMSTISIKDLPHCQMKSRLTHYIQGNWKHVSFSYFHQEATGSLDIRAALTQFALTKHVYVPDAVIAVLMKYHMPLATAVDAVASFIRVNANELSYERTSEVFIKESEKRFFPVINNSFVSHFYLRK